MKKNDLIRIFFFLGFITLSIFVLPILAIAQTQFTSATSVPGSYGATVGTGGPGAFIANFYQYSLYIAGILAFGIIVYGGIRYMTSAGNPSAASDAKEWIEAALLGLLLLAGAYFILAVINPQLLNLNLPSLSGANVNLSGISVPGGGATITSGGSGTGSTGVAGAKCQAPPSGPCSVAALQNTCLGSAAGTAAGVCNVESNGSNVAGGDLSTNVAASGKRLPASVGLFQINLSANSITGLNGQTLNCPSAFSNPYTGTNPHTTITNMDLYNQCVAAAENPAINIAKACSLSKNATTWKMWGPSTLHACGL
jgi:hypothetical protein